MARGDLSGAMNVINGALHNNVAAHCNNASGFVSMMTVGFPDPIARSPEDYVRLATALARDTPRLTAFRRGFREQMRQSPLMNEPKFVLNIETLYRQVCMQWCQGTAN